MVGLSGVKTIRGNEAGMPALIVRGSWTLAPVQPLTTDWSGRLVKPNRTTKSHRAKGQD